jgi:hypothetical protein
MYNRSLTGQASLERSQPVRRSLVLRRIPTNPGHVHVASLCSPAIGVLQGRPLARTKPARTLRRHDLWSFGYGGQAAGAPWGNSATNGLLMPLSGSNPPPCSAHALRGAFRERGAAAYPSGRFGSCRRDGGLQTAIQGLNRRVPLGPAGRQAGRGTYFPPLQGLRFGMPTTDQPSTLAAAKGRP